MKKILNTLLILAFAGVITYAQEDRGKYSIDINVNPAALFDANAGPMFQMPLIKGRYFLQPDLAFRLGLGIGFSNDKTYLDDEGNDYYKTTSSSLSLLPGIEKQYGGEKFVGYIGVELPIMSVSYKEVDNIDGEETIVKNPDDSGYLGLGLNLVLGFDYYLIGNVYVGAEFSPGFMFKKYKDELVDDDVEQKGGTDMTFNLSASSGIRLGVRF